MRSLKGLALLGLVFFAIPYAHAGATAVPSALSARIVSFIYNRNQTYTLYLRPGMVTDIVLPPGERLLSLALGDTVRWITQQVPGTGHIMIKPVVPGIETSATMVVNGRSYQMMLVSRAKGDWYQEVRFQAQSPIVYLASPKQASALPSVNTGAPANLAGKKNTNANDAMANINVTNMRFDWHVIGKAKFAPEQVFSTHDFVWMRLAAGAPSPVAFVRLGDQWGIVNYNRRGNWLVVQGAPSAIELRANGLSVIVAQKAYIKRNASQYYSSNGGY